LQTLITRLLVLTVTALWLLGIFNIFYSSQFLSDILGWCLAIFVIFAVTRTRWHTQILLVVLGMATVSLAAIYDQWAVIPLGLSKASLFAAFLGTIVLIRATAEQRPEIKTARNLLARIDPREQAGGLILGTHLVASVLQVGVFAILAPILGSAATAEERRRIFLMAIKGMAMIPMWSPFIVGMAVATEYIPTVPLWQIMALGLSLVTLGLLISVAAFDRSGGLPAMWRALRTLSPIVPPITVAAALVIGMTTMTTYSTLQSLIIVMPVPCILSIAMSRDGNLLKALKSTTDGLSRIGSEVSLLALATTLGITFQSCLPELGLLNDLKALALSPTAVIFIVIMSMNILGLMGVQSIASGTILLVIFTSIPTGVADLILLEALLIGWGLCTAMSVGSLSITTGAAMFQLAPTNAISAKNILWVFVTSAIFGAILSAINPLFIS